MKHPGPEELVDLLDDAGSSAAREHVNACQACRTRLEELRAAESLASEVEVPEPSPLFWDHLSARVRERIAEEPSAAERRAWSWVMPAALAFGVLLLVVARLSVDDRAVTPAEIATGTGTDVAIEPLPVDEGSWAVLASISEDLTWDEVADAGLTVAPGAADRAALQLTVEEQRELVRLLRAEVEIKGT